ncbi:MAG TPA: magnesium transporter CorA family protein [Rhizomicrobium sp.]|jgi:magnesium transporter|nr:magnesium transporter CorA family protein [Rhizomicrobium sp.]
MLFTYPGSGSAPSLKGAVWIDLYNPTREEIDAAAKELGIPIPTRDELDEIESSSRLQSEDDGRLLLSLPLIAHGEEEGPTPLGFVLAPAYLLTVRFTKMSTFDMAVKLLARQKQSCSSGEIFAMLVEAMVDFSADTLEKTNTVLNEVSRNVFKRYGSTRQHNISRSNRRMREALVDVGGAGDNLSQIRESILGLQRIIPFITDKGKGWIEEKIGARLNVVSQDLTSLSDFEVHLSNKVQFLLDAVLGFINIEQNDIFKVLTIASVVGIPPTFIASMYGMNFHNMPEYSWAYGYEWGLGLIFLSTVLPIIWFKWRGWW